MRRLAPFLIIMVALLIGLTAIAHAASWRHSPSQGWTVYRTGHVTKVSTIWVRTKCIAGEDSAAHLRLIEYGDGVAVYGCSHTGY